MASITRFDPFSEMVTLRQAMDRLFEDSVVSPVAWRPGNGDGVPAIDVYQTQDELVVTAALPGLKPEDVEITITGQTLSIRGEFTEDAGIDRDMYLYRERRFGAFHRQLQLPVRVQGDRSTATFEDGLLKLVIPKAEEVKPRQIHVRAAPKTVESSTNGDTA